MPGDLVHMIANLVNGEHLIQGQEERQEYLHRLGQALGACDWLLLGYGLMSSHVHLDLIAGIKPFDTLARRVHPPFSTWLNRRQGRRGPVLAERPDTYLLDPLKMNRLLAYIHNNPVRAGLCLDAAGSTWTSHRAYLGLEPAPSWLNVELGLQLCGFTTCSAGRSAFSAFVDKQLEEPDDWLIGRDELIADRREAREALGRAIELAYPRLDPDENQVVYPVLTDEGIPLHPRWLGPLSELLMFVARTCQLEVSAIQSTNRKRNLVNARRLMLLMARQEMGRGLSETSRILGITHQSGSKLIRTASKEKIIEAQELTRKFLRDH